MPEINITVLNKVASCSTKSIVNGNSDYIVNWTLDSAWDKYETKTMRVSFCDGTFSDTVFSGKRCSLPIISDAALIEIGLFAGDLITTTPATVRCARCITDASGSPADPTPDVYNQIMERLNNLEGVNPATADKLGVVKIGENLKITKDGVLSVDTADAVEQDNTKPVTSAAVHTEIGNIEVLLAAL